MTPGFAARDNPPAGYEQLPDRVAYEKQAGPFYRRLGPSGRWQMGFRVTEGKLNAMGVCHGGVLATFADVLGSAVKRNLGLVRRSPTITLSLDFAAPAPLGAWVDSEPELVRETGSMLFISAIARADGVICLRASGIYRLLNPQA